MSESLKTNTTLKGLYIGRKIEVIMSKMGNPLLTFRGIYTTENWIERTGATSLSELLKINTTLTALYIYCEDKKKLSTKDEIIIFLIPFIAS